MAIERIDMEVPALSYTDMAEGGREAPLTCTLGMGIMDLLGGRG